MEEQIIKTVVRSGNGGAVWVPRSWMGENVIVTRIEKPENLKERIFKILKPFLENIIGVFIYGSYARKEETSKSDVDILIVIKDKKEIKFIKEKGLDIQVVEIDKLSRTIESNPIMYYSLIQEAIPLINKPLLDELKKIEINYKKFRWFIQTSKENIKTNKEFLEMDKLDGDYTESSSVIYSLILRLRGVFLIECIMKKQKFSNKSFKKWIVNNINIPDNEYHNLYKIYQALRDNQKINKIEIKIISVERLLDFLTKEIKRVEEKIG